MDKDKQNVLRALVLLDSMSTDPSRIKFNRKMVWRKDRVVKTIQDAMTNPLDAMKMHRQLVREEYISPDRYTSRIVDGFKSTFKVNWIDTAKCLWELTV